MRIVGIAVVAALVAGCGSFGGPPSAYDGMTAEQIRAVVSDKSSSIVCTRALYAGASLTIMAINTDKGIPAGVTVSEECRASIDTKPPVPGPPSR